MEEYVMSNQKSFKTYNFNANDFAQQLANYYQSQNCEVQVIESPNGVMIQSRAREFFKKASVALTITATIQEDLVTIQSGNAKWAVNAVSSVAALIVFWPLLGLTAYTSYKQKQLIDDTWQLVDQYMLSISAVPAMAPVMTTVSTPAPAATRAVQPNNHGLTCPSCGKPVRIESKFCDHCGKPVGGAVCGKCGASLRLDAKFCDSCGNAV
jgi:hypothetical protein